MLFCLIFNSCQFHLLCRFYNQHNFNTVKYINNIYVIKYRVDTQNCFLYSFLCSNQKNLMFATFRIFSQLNHKSSIENIVQQGMNFPSSPYLTFSNNDI